MAASLLFLGGSGGSTISAGGSITVYGTVGNGGPGYTTQTAEATVQHKCAVAGTLSNLYVNVTSNSRNGTSVYTVRLNTAASTLTVTHNAGVTGAQSDTAHSPSVAADDLLAGQIVLNGTSGSYGAAGICMRFDPSGSTAVPYIACTTGSGLTYSGSGPLNVYAPVAGRLNTTPASENEARLNIGYAGTAKYMQMQVLTNGRSSSTVITFRINKAAATQTKTYASGATGLVVDTSNTDAIAAGDLIDLEIALGTGTGNFIVNSTGVWVVSNIEGQTGTGAGDTGTVSMAAGATSFTALSGRNSVNATESIVQQEPGTAATATNLWVNVATNASSTNAVTAFRNGSVTGNQSVTLTAGTTGPFQDTTHSDSFGATDLINAQTNNVTTGAITVSLMSMMLWTDVSKAITGNSATASPGTIAPAVSAALSGIASTASPGTVAPSLSAALSGISSTATPGSISAASLLTIGLTGIGATASPGTVNVGGDKTIALTGSAATASAGNLAFGLALPLTGSAITASPGSLSRASLITLALTGAGATCAAGTMTASGGNTSIWTPATPASGIWAPATPDSQVWTPASASTTTWTRQ